MGGDMLNVMKYISIVPFSGLFNWSVQYLNDSKIAFSKAYPMMRIGEFLKRNKTAVTIQDGVKYKRVTIKVRNGGVVPRDEVMGENIGTKKQFLVSEGQFILSKIDARNGAMGIIPAELNSAVVTQDFLPYDIDTTKVNPQYFVLVCTTKQFVEFCQSCSRGTTNRQRVDEAQFLNIKVPVPSLEEQNKLVEEYNAAIAKATICNDEITSISQDLSKTIKLLLGYKDDANSDSKHGGILTFSSLSKISRWDWWNDSMEQESLLYPMQKLAGIITMQSGSFLPKNKQINGNVPIYGGNGITGFHNIHCFSGKRIVIGRVGEYCGNVHLVEGEYWITDNALKVDKISDNVSWEYLSIALESMNLNQYRSISAQPSISQSKILNLSIPIPPTVEQKRIVDFYYSKKNQLTNLHRQADKYRIVALKNFETQIFE